MRGRHPPPRLVRVRHRFVDLVVDLHVRHVGARAFERVERRRVVRRHPEEREMAVRAREVVEALPCLCPLPVFDALAQPVGGGDLELELGDGAEHPDGNLGGVERIGIVFADVDHLTARRDDAHAAHGRREAAELQARAVRRGRHGAGDLLGDDVSLVREREPARPQRLAEVADGRRGADDDATALRIDRADAAEPAHVEQQTVRRDDRRERMARARDTHGEPSLRGVRDERRHFVFAARHGDLDRLARLIPDPVRPRVGGEHARSLRRRRPAYHRAMVADAQRAYRSPE